MSDVAAMGGRPRACLLALGLPEELTGEYFEQLITGFLTECRFYDMPLVGGDLSRSDRVVVSVSAWGFVDSGVPVRRSGAQPDDHVLLIGNVGYSRLGLEYLERKNRIGLSELSSEDQLREWASSQSCFDWLKAHFLPDIHLEPAIWIREKGLANAMIDVSDGLGHDLIHILTESCLSGEILVKQLLTPSGLEDVGVAREYALNGGEDYALLFTVSDDQLEELNRHYPEHYPPFVIIGRLYSGAPVLHLVDGDGRLAEYTSEGFSHFK
jgi:thiamine-monophosphate kinase